MVDTAKDLTGKVAMVVGAGPGVGRATAQAIARDGADVVLAARRPEALEELAAEVADLTGRRVEGIVADLSDNGSLVALVDEAVARVGGVDALVTVATAGGGQIPIDQADWEMWQHAYQVNVIGTMEVSRQAARSMATRGGGSIVNISSPQGKHGKLLRGPYSAAKFGVEGLTQVLALEIAARNNKFVQTPEFKSIKGAGHELGDFFFVPRSKS